MFSYIEERTSKKIQGWNEKLLNQARKEILLKAVITSPPTYAMSVFLISKRICENINKNKGLSGGVK